MAHDRKYNCLKNKEEIIHNIFNPYSLLPERKCVNIRGREEHEAIIKDGDWCSELGLDQIYETILYLKRWGEWLKN